MSQSATDSIRCMTLSGRIAARLRPGRRSERLRTERAAFMRPVQAAASACEFLLCSGALFVLRRREPTLRRPYRAFGYPWVPGIALITSAALLVVFVLGNTGPSLLAIGVVAVTYPLFRFVQRRRSPPPALDA